MQREANSGRVECSPIRFLMASVRETTIDTSGSELFDGTKIGEESPRSRRRDYRQMFKV
jgi:hypothetical protein